MSVKLQETNSFKIVISFAKSLALKSKSNILNPLNVLLGSYVAWKNKEINEDIEFFKNESKALETLAKKNKISLVKVIPEKKQKLDLDSDLKGILKNNNSSSLINFVNDLLVYEGLIKKEESLLLKLENLSNAYSWEQIKGSNKLKAWSDRLIEALKKKRNEDYWQLVGRGVIIVNADPIYCSRVLKTVAKSSRMNFITVKKENVLNIPQVEKLKTLAPLIVYLEAGPWKRDPDDDVSERRRSELEDMRELVKARLIDFNPADPIVFVTSTADLNDLVADDLKASGLFDLYISIPNKAIDLIGREFISELGENICAPSFLKSIEKIGHLVRSYKKEKWNLTILSLKRLNFEENRKIEYKDLANAEIHSLIEEGLVVEKNEEQYLNTAYHEGGHALIAILEYEGINIPDYVSILPGASGFLGATLSKESFLSETNLLDGTTYSNFRREIRVSLAGRAGEEILVGSEYISDGASGDLEHAFNKAWRYFSRNGFAPAMDKPNNSESNLAIVRNFDDPSSSEKAHLENLIRHFLSEEYKVVRDRLMKNKLILDAIAQALIKDPIVDQDELAMICEKHNLKVIKY